MKIILSGNLRDLYPKKKREEIMSIDHPITVYELLNKLQINPFVILTVLVNGETKSKDTVLDPDTEEIMLFGPMAGG